MDKLKEIHGTLTRTNALLAAILGVLIPMSCHSVRQFQVDQIGEKLDRIDAAMKGQ